MNLSIREFNPTEREYEAMAQIQNAIWPHMPVTTAELKFQDDHFNPDYSWKRFMLDANGETIGFAEIEDPYWSYQPGKYSIGIHIHPKHQNNGYGSKLYEFLSEQLHAKNPVKYISQTREDDPSSIHFLQNRGFKQTMRFATSELDLTAFNAKPFQQAIDRVTNEGTELVSLVQLKERDSDWMQKLYDLRWDILRDVPTPDPLTQDTIEQWDKEVLNNPRIFEDSWMIAIDGDQYVGYSNLWKIPARADKLDTGLTGVIRSHRRKGVCTAMKIKAFDAAKTLGVKIIETENEENNPMYQINMALGFEPRPAWLSFEKLIREMEPHELEGSQ